VSRPVELVVPISLTELLGQLHHVLRSYKREDYPERVREPFRLQVSALLARFLWEHGDCIRNAAGDDWDAITIVPSSQGRTEPHPLEEAIGLFPFLRDQYRSLLGPGPSKALHNQASDDAFSVVEDVNGLRVLLVDDTFYYRWPGAERGVGLAACRRARRRHRPDREGHQAGLQRGGCGAPPAGEGASVRFRDVLPGMKRADIIYR
jgi:hypothetical protein